MPVGAKSESFVMGPYKVSFDMGTVGTHSITTNSSEKDTFEGTPYTDYVATIKGTPPLEVDMFVRDFHGASRSADEKKTLEGAMKSFSFVCGEQTVVARTIDGKPGAMGVLSCLGSTYYAIRYPLDYSSENDTLVSEVVIASTYPWDEGTSSLVKTIHVEKS